MMNTMSHSPNWPVIKVSEGLKEDSFCLGNGESNQHRVTCYKITHMLRGFKIWQFDFFIEKWGNQQFQELENFKAKMRALKEKAPATIVVGVFPIQKRNIALHEIISKLVVQWNAPRQGVYQEQFGLTAEEQEKALNAVFAHSLAMMNDMPAELTFEKADQVASEWLKVIHRWRNKLLVDCGYRQKKERFELTPEDWHFLGLDPTKPTPYLEQLDCTGYAFLKMREKQAVGWIRSWITTRQSTEKSRFYEDDPIAFLQEWGYRRVENPREGDLVVYFNTFKRPACPIATHSGIYRDEGCVESKMNMQYPEIWQSPLAVVPANCGNRVAFFRKSG